MCRAHNAYLAEKEYGKEAMEPYRRSPVREPGGKLMNDALLVRRFEPFGDLLEQRQRLTDGYRAGDEPFRQRFSFDQLHHEELLAVRLFDPVDGGDVRVVQRCQKMRFPLEASEPLRVLGEIVGKDFDGDFAPELGVAGAVDPAHAASTERREDLETTEAGSGRKGLSFASFRMRI